MTIRYVPRMAKTLNKKPASTTRTPRSKAKAPVEASSAETTTDTHQLAANMARACELWQRIMQTSVAKSLANPPNMGHTDPLSAAESMLHAARTISVDPQKIAEAQLGFMNEHLKLWQWWTGKMLGRDDGAYVEPAARDRRFADDTWMSGAADYVKQNYLVNARWLENFVSEMEGIDGLT